VQLYAGVAGIVVVTVSVHVAPLSDAPAGQLYVMVAEVVLVASQLLPVRTPVGQ
jgi:hypothetical protein